MRQVLYGVRQPGAGRNAEPRPRESGHGVAGARARCKRNGCLFSTPGGGFESSPGREPVDRVAHPPQSPRRAAIEAFSRPCRGSRPMRRKKPGRVRIPRARARGYSQTPRAGLRPRSSVRLFRGRLQPPCGGNTSEIGMVSPD